MTWQNIIFLLDDNIKTFLGSKCIIIKPKYKSKSYIIYYLIGLNSNEAELEFETLGEALLSRPFCLLSFFHHQVRNTHFNFDRNKP